ncbi:MAG: TonB C-terminal domain-containing protein [Desulfovibrionaceae bacterium]|nr:TonB C-terminal domain-containing protein [Desulfovibrionaceae bacterium]
MRTGSFLLSLLLHLAVLAAMALWPARAPLPAPRPVYQVSLVMGDPGGENLPSAVLGRRQPPTVEPSAPAALAAPAMDDAPELTAPSARAPELQQAVPQPSSVPAALPAEEPVPVPQEPGPAPQPALPAEPPKPEPEPRPAPEPDKKPETPPEPPKPKEKPKEEPKPPAKPAQTKKTPPSAAARALANLRRQNSESSAASRALADLQQGGGGGVGDGPGGGGLYDVYVGQVMLLVQSNWSLPTYSRENLVVQVRIVQDAAGNIQDCKILRSSGRGDVDASAVNAVLRTGQLPPPPTLDQHELIITFNTQDMAAR